MSDASVVDAVARHGHDLAAPLPGLHDPQLVLGRHAGVDGDRAHLDRHPFVRQAVEFSACHDAVRGAGHAELPADRQRGGRMVAGDHHGADARRPAPLDRLPGLVARRIDHPREAHVHQIPLGDRRLGVERLAGGKDSAGQREHPQRAARHLRGDGEDLTAAVVREWHHRPVA
jgi:hypothetical protein